MLIISTVALGARLIGVALQLDNKSSGTAVMLLGLALIGVMIQYAQYLRELNVAQSLPPAPEPALPEIGWSYDKR